MARKKKRFYNAEGERYMKKEDMIMENYSMHANLPQQVIMRDYPRVDYGEMRAYDDSRSGMDRQVANDSRALRAHPSKKRRV